MNRSIPIAAAFAVWVGVAHADGFTDSIVANLQGLGYEFIEIQNGIGQVKVEAIRGAEKLEVIYDRATGQILKQEREQAELSETGRSGVQVRDRNRDFLDDRNDEDNDDHDSSGHGSGGGDDDDDDNSGSGSSNSGSGSGDDDHDED